MAVTPSSTEELLVEQRDRVAVFTLNRPDRLNAISRDMLDELSKKMVEANKDPDTRCIVLTGSGKGFCAGLDLVDVGEGGIGSGEKQGSNRPRQLFDLRDAPINVMWNIDTPIVCAVNGAAAGYGMDMALGCDMRIMADTAKLAAAFTSRGIVPESGGTWILPRLIGWSKASEIIFTGKTLTASECDEMGLVSEVVNNNEVGSAALALAKRIAAQAPMAVQASKRMMRMGMDENFDDHVHHVFLQLLPLFQSDDFKEGMASFMEKREAEFKGR